MRLIVALGIGAEPETVYDGPDAAGMGDALTLYLETNMSESYARKVKRWWSTTALPKVLDGQEPELRLSAPPDVHVWKVYQD